MILIIYVFISRLINKLNTFYLLSSFKRNKKRFKYFIPKTKILSVSSYQTKNVERDQT